MFCRQAKQANVGETGLLLWAEDLHAGQEGKLIRGLKIFVLFPEYGMPGEFGGALEAELLLDPVAIGADGLDAEFHALGYFPGRKP